MGFMGLVRKILRYEGLSGKIYFAGIANAFSVKFRFCRYYVIRWSH